MPYLVADLAHRAWCAAIVASAAASLTAVATAAIAAATPSRVLDLLAFSMATATIAAATSSRVAAMSPLAATATLVAVDVVCRRAADVVVGVLNLVAMLVRQQMRVDLVQGEIILHAE
jgi:hypothetical protein